MTARILAIAIMCVLVVCGSIAIRALASDTTDLSAQINATMEAVDRTSKSLKEWQDKLDERSRILDERQKALDRQAELLREMSDAMDRRSAALDRMEELLRPEVQR